MDPVTLPLAVALTIVTLAASIAGSYAVTKFRSERAEQRAEAAERRAEAVEKELAEFKLDAAKRYVTDEMLMKVEERILVAVNRLGDRLDRVLDAPRPRRGGAA